MDEYIERESIYKILLMENPFGWNNDDLAELFREAKAADVAPVIHAHWVSASKKQGVNIGMKCSLCGARIKNSEFFNGNHNYCHKCGAQMDEKEDKHEDYT